MLRIFPDPDHSLHEDNCQTYAVCMYMIVRAKDRTLEFVQVPVNVYLAE